MAGCHNGARKMERDEQGLNEMEVKRMQVWFADLGTHDGKCLQEGERPVLIISNDRANRNCPAVTVIPMTSKIKKLHLPSHIVIGEHNIKKATDRPFREALLLLEQITTIDKKSLIAYVGKVNSPVAEMSIGLAIKAQLGMEGI